MSEHDKCGQGPGHSLVWCDFEEETLLRANGTVVSLVGSRLGRDARRRQDRAVNSGDPFSLAATLGIVEAAVLIF